MAQRGADGWIRHAHVEQIMGTAISIHVVGDENMPIAECNERFADVFAELRDVDAAFSPYLPDSLVSRIGRGELDVDDAGADMRAVALACAQYEAETDGRFSARWRGVFDPTGYVKGWSVEKAAARHLAGLIERTGIAAVGINAGGDMQLYTDPNSGWTWQVGIADPANLQKLVATVEVENGAVATSGSAERGMHIRDPRTGQPVTSIAQATVVADSLTHADVWATAACVAGWDLSWLARADTRMGLIVSPDGDVRRWTGGVEVAIAAPGLVSPGAVA